jgi:hypothetical protein
MTPGSTQKAESFFIKTLSTTKVHPDFGTDAVIIPDIRDHFLSLLCHSIFVLKIDKDDTNQEDSALGFLQSPRGVIILVDVAKAFDIERYFVFKHVKGGNGELVPQARQRSVL